MTFVPFSEAEGFAIRKSAHATAVTIANLYIQTKNLNMEIHAIVPSYLGLTAFSFPRHFQGTLDEACSLVADGWWNNDPTDCLVLRVFKGREYISELELRHIFDLEDHGRKAVDDAYKRWGVWKDGEDLDWLFLYTSADYLDCFPEGYVVCPEGKRVVFRTGSIIVNGPVL